VPVDADGAAVTVVVTVNEEGAADVGERDGSDPVQPAVSATARTRLPVRLITAGP
jgi:hypothetical protein